MFITHFCFNIIKYVNERPYHNTFNFLLHAKQNEMKHRNVKYKKSFEQLDFVVLGIILLDM